MSERRQWRCYESQNQESRWQSPKLKSLSRFLFLTYGFPFLMAITTLPEAGFSEKSLRAVSFRSQLMTWMSLGLSIGYHNMLPIWRGGMDSTAFSTTAHDPRLTTIPKHGV